MSVTRTFILVFGSMFVIPILLQWRVVLRSALAMRLGGIGALLVAAIGLFVIFGNESAERWATRLTSSSEIGFDLTAATRQAETNHQMETLLSSPASLIIGSGLAAESIFTGEAADLVEWVLGPSGVEYSHRGFGHNTYVSILYLGGLLSGGLLLALLLFNFIWSLLLIRRSLNSRHDPLLRLVALWGAVSVVGFCVYGTLAGTFGDRTGSLYYGLAIGLTYAVAPYLMPRRSLLKRLVRSGAQGQVRSRAMVK